MASAPTVESLNGWPALVTTSGASSAEVSSVLPVDLGLLDHALRAVRNGERDAQHPGISLGFRGIGLATLVVDPRIAIAALAEVPLDAELRILEQVFVHGMLARDRHETIAVARSERIALKDDFDARSRLDAQHEAHRRIAIDVSRKLQTHALRSNPSLSSRSRT